MNSPDNKTSLKRFIPFTTERKEHKMMEEAYATNEQYNKIRTPEYTSETLASIQSDIRKKSNFFTLRNTAGALGLIFLLNKCTGLTDEERAIVIDTHERVTAITQCIKKDELNSECSDIQALADFDKPLSPQEKSDAIMSILKSYM